MTTIIATIIGVAAVTALGIFLSNLDSKNNAKPSQNEQKDQKSSQKK